MSRSALSFVIVFGALVILGQATYTVSETEQIIITQFGEPVGDPVVSPGLHFKIAVHPAHQRLREALPGMGRQSEPGPDPRQALHLGRHLRPLAHRRSAALLPAPARRARGAVAARRHPRRGDPQRRRAPRPDRTRPQQQPRPGRRADRVGGGRGHSRADRARPAGGDPARFWTPPPGAPPTSASSCSTFASSASTTSRRSSRTSSRG